MTTEAKVVIGGREIATRRLSGLGSEPKRIHWGTGTTAPADGDTNLETPSAESKVEGSTSVITTTTTGDTYRAIGTLTSASNQTITEAGLFDGSDTLFLRGTFSGIPLESGDSIQFTIESQNQAPA